MFNLVDLPPAPRGVPQIEVTFDIDANGILNVTAKDRGTGKENKIRITASTKLSKEEKERLIKDAEQFQEQDRQKKEEAETRNNADSLVYTADRTKSDLAGKISPEEVAKIDTAVTELKNALASKIWRSQAMKHASSPEVGTKVYQQGTRIRQTARRTETTSRSTTRAGPKLYSSGEQTGPEGEHVVTPEDYKIK
jgi:molecular chaperone DnaK